MEKVYSIDELQAIITPIAKKHKVSRVYVFGSYARGDANETSDIDLRIDAEQMRTLFELGGLYSDLEDALQKPLDMVTTQALRQKKNDPLTRRFIRRMKENERLLYEENATN